MNAALNVLRFLPISGLDFGDEIYEFITLNLCPVFGGRLTNPIYDINPYTDIDALVKKLFNISETIIFIDINEQISLYNIDFIVTLIEKSIKVSIKNNKDKSIVLNEIKFFKNQEASRITLENKLITPSSNINIEFSSEGILELIIKYENKKVMIEF